MIPSILKSFLKIKSLSVVTTGCMWGVTKDASKVVRRRGQAGFLLSEVYDWITFLPLSLTYLYT